MLFAALYESNGGAWAPRKAGSLLPRIGTVHRAWRTSALSIPAVTPPAPARRTCLRTSLNGAARRRAELCCARARARHRANGRRPAGATALSALRRAPRARSAGRCSRSSGACLRAAHHGRSCGAVARARLRQRVARWHAGVDAGPKQMLQREGRMQQGACTYNEAGVRSRSVCGQADVTG